MAGSRRAFWDAAPVRTSRLRMTTRVVEDAFRTVAPQTLIDELDHR
jgi:hypothetical protein